MENKEITKKDEKKVSVSIIIAAVIFIISLFFVIGVFIITGNKKDLEIPTSQQENITDGNKETAQEDTSNQSTLPKQENVEITGVDATNDPDIEAVTETSNEFPTGSLNDNSYPFFEYDVDTYIASADTIKSIKVQDGLPENTAQDVKEAYACWLQRMEWTEPVHDLVVDKQQGDWYSVKDMTYDFDMWANRKLNVCVDKCEGMDANTIYNCYASVFNYYNTTLLTLEPIPGYDGRIPVYVYQHDEFVILNSITYTVIDVVPVESENQNE